MALMPSWLSAKVVNVECGTDSKSNTAADAVVVMPANIIANAILIFIAVAVSAPKYAFVANVFLFYHAANTSNA